MRLRLVIFFSLVVGVSALLALLSSAQAAVAHGSTAQATHPSHRLYAAMAYDPALHEVILFGGAATPPWRRDTWAFDGTSWTKLSPAVSPQGRGGARMAYDEATGQLVLFGGKGNRHPLNDTWVFDGTTWTKEHPAHVPPVRDSPGFAYDPAHGQIVMFGGYQGCFGCDLNDTWTWDGNDWTQHHTANAPSPRSDGGMAYDAARGQIVFFGGIHWPTVYGDTWTWDGTNWTLLTPPLSPRARSGLMMAYDPVSEQTVMFGGGATETRFPAMSDTWTWDGSTWTHVAPEPALRPSRRGGAGFAYDADIGQIVMFGGLAADGATSLGSTWSWDGSAWQRLATG
jgi:hypothetical protein